MTDSQMSDERIEIVVDFSILISVMANARLISLGQADADFDAALEKHVYPLAIKELQAMIMIKPEEMQNRLTFEEADEYPEDVEQVADPTKSAMEEAQSKLLLASRHFQAMQDALQQSLAGIYKIADQESGEYPNLAAELKAECQALSNAATATQEAWRGEYLCRMLLEASKNLI